MRLIHIENNKITREDVEKLQETVKEKIRINEEKIQEIYNEELLKSLNNTLEQVKKEKSNNINVGDNDE